MTVCATLGAFRRDIWQPSSLTASMNPTNENLRNAGKQALGIRVDPDPHKIHQGFVHTYTIDHTECARLKGHANMRSFKLACAPTNKNDHSRIWPCLAAVLLGHCAVSDYCFMLFQPYVYVVCPAACGLLPPMRVNLRIVMIE